MKCWPTLLNQLGEVIAPQAKCEPQNGKKHGLGDCDTHNAAFSRRRINNNDQHGQRNKFENSQQALLPKMFATEMLA